MLPNEVNEARYARYHSQLISGFTGMWAVQEQRNLQMVALEIVKHFDLILEGKQGWYEFKIHDTESMFGFDHAAIASLVRGNPYVRPVLLLTLPRLWERSQWHIL